MFYVFDKAAGFDRVTAAAHETLADAGWHILGDDMAACGFDWVNGEYLPWQKPHRLPRREMHIFARASETEALEAIAMSDAFSLECFTEEQAARFEAADL